MYAVIETGGKQHKVEKGMVLSIDLTKDEANYSVGVYRRDLSDQPLGHIVQDRAIQYFLDLGLKRYKIGHKPFQTFDSELSQKEKSISEFKSGFGAELVAEPQLNKMN